MDTQRLILFVVFSVLGADAVGGVAEGIPAAAARGRRRRPRSRRPPTDLPPAPAAARLRRLRAARPARRRRPAPTRNPRRRPHGHDRHGPLSRGGRHDRRRDRPGRAPQASRSGRRGEALPRAARRRPSARSSRNRDCWARACRTIAPSTRRSRVRASSRPAPIGSSCKLQAVAPNGDRIVQVLTFHRGTYVIDVAYDITNAGTAPIAPFAYFQFTRDTKTQGSQNSMAPVVVCRPGHLQRDRQVQEGRIRRARQASGRSRPASFRTPRTPTTAGSRWSSITSSPRGCRATTRRRRASSMRGSSTAASTRREWSCRSARSRRARPARSACRSTSARRSRTSSRVSRRASTSSSTTASSR